MKQILYFITLFFIVNSHAQSVFSAKEILLKVIESNGGATWQQPKTLQLKGKAVFTPYGITDDSVSISFDTYNMFRVFPATNNAAHQANGKIRFDAFYNNNNFMQLIFDGSKTNSYYSERAKPYQKHFSWSNNFGFSIIRFALQDSFKVNLLADDQIEGFNCYTIQIIDPSKGITLFNIDKKKFFIRGLSFNTDQGFHSRIYSNFKKIKTKDGQFFMQPGRLRIYFDGIKWMDINWLKTIVNDVIEDSVFASQTNIR